MEYTYTRKSISHYTHLRGPKPYQGMAYVSMAQESYCLYDRYPIPHQGIKSFHQRALEFSPGIDACTDNRLAQEAIGSGTVQAQPGTPHRFPQRRLVRVVDHQYVLVTGDGQALCAQRGHHLAPREKDKQSRGPELEQGQ